MILSSAFFLSTSNPHLVLTSIFTTMNFLKESCWKKIKLNPCPPVSNPAATPTFTSSQVCFRHTELGSSDRRSQTSILSAQGSPSKNVAPSTSGGRTEDATFLMGDDFSGDPVPFLDPAYVHELDSCQSGPPKRKRTALVSLDSCKLRVVDQLICNLTRICPCNSGQSTVIIF